VKSDPIAAAVTLGATVAPVSVDAPRDARRIVFESKAFDGVGAQPVQYDDDHALDANG